MPDDRKTLASFLATINPILKREDIKIEMKLTRERALGLPTTLVSFEEEFPEVDLYDLQSGDTLYIHYFLTIKGLICEGFCMAKCNNEEKIMTEFVNLDSVHPPMKTKTAEGFELYRKFEKKIKEICRVIIDSLNSYLKSE